ncbi:MAG: porin [Sulfuricaulis sp.]
MLLRKTAISKFMLGTGYATLLFSMFSTAQAANWLMLEGTEPPGAIARANLSGFIQADYQVDTSKPNSTGGYIPPEMLGPDLNSQSGFNVSRARIGVRGTPIPQDSNVNYLLLAEFGNDGITYVNSTNHSTAKLTDASITLNQISGARIRLGLFKYPGAEEGLQTVQTLDYINFTSVTDQLLDERFPNRQWTANIAPCNPTQTSACNMNGFDRPVGAFHDTGVQVFDAFTNGNWENSYAVMVGNGNGLNFTNKDNHKDVYVYLSSEKIYGGAGPLREGLKFFIWSQTGKREFDGNDNGHFETYKRDRAGFGMKFLRRPWRFTAEYMTGNGMIWNSPSQPSWALTTSQKNPAGDDNGLEAKAKGWYTEGGWYIPNTKWELDLRYDVYYRLNGRINQLDWKTWTVGTQYHINKATRLTFNCAMRNIYAPNFGSGLGPNSSLAGIKNRYGVQVTSIF